MANDGDLTITDTLVSSRRGHAQPQRIRLSCARGYRMPEGAVKVDRSTRWGNMFWPGQRIISPGAYGCLASPYHGCRPTGEYGSGPRSHAILKVRNREDAVRLFHSYVRADPSGWNPEDLRYELGAQHLACWCPLPEPGGIDWCHAAVLMALANGRQVQWLDNPRGSAA